MLQRNLALHQYKVMNPSWHVHRVKTTCMKDDLQYVKRLLAAGSSMNEEDQEVQLDNNVLLNRHTGAQPFVILL